MTSQLFEMTYNECNPIAENAYLESPLDTELKPPMLMEEIYFECNIKPLFEPILREADNTSKPEYYGVYEGNELVNNVGPASKETAYARYKKAPAYGSINPTLSRSGSENEPYYK